LVGIFTFDSFALVIFVFFGYFRWHWLILVALVILVALDILVGIVISLALVILVGFVGIFLVGIGYFRLHFSCWHWLFLLALVILVSIGYSRWH